MRLDEVPRAQNLRRHLLSESCNCRPYTCTTLRLNASLNFAPYPNLSHAVDWGQLEAKIVTLLSYRVSQSKSGRFQFSTPWMRFTNHFK